MSERGRPRSFDRAAALERAMEVFWAKDYDGASLADLRAAMGINAPSLYAAFGSKEQLFREAVVRYGQTQGTDIWRAVAETPRVRDAFARFLQLSARAFTRPGKPRGCLIALTALHANEGNAAVCRELTEYRRGNLAALRDRLRRAVDERELPATLDADGVAAFYAAVQHGMSILARDGTPRPALLAVADHAMAGWERITGQRARRGARRA